MTWRPAPRWHRPPFAWLAASAAPLVRLQVTIGFLLPRPGRSIAQVSRNNYKLHQGPAARSIAAGGQGKLRLLLVSEPRTAATEFRQGFEQNMHRRLAVFSIVLLMLMHNAQAQPLTVDPESIVPLPDKFDIVTPTPDVPPEIARFHGAWIGTWHDDRHILVVERVKPDGHANVVFAQSDSAFYGMNREWWRVEATIADGVLTMTGFRIFRYAFDGPDRLYMTATLKLGGVTSGTLVRTDVARLAAGERPVDWPWPGERVWIPHLTVRTPDGARPIMLGAPFYPPAGPGPAPLAIFTHGSDVGRNQLRTWSFSTEAHWLRDNGFAVLALMRRGRGRSEGINGEENFGRDHDGGLIDVSAGVAQAVEDLDSAIAYGRTLPNVRPGPVLLAGQSRGGFHPCTMRASSPAR